MGLISNGTTVFDAGAMSAGFGGSMTFIKKLTASSSATLSFVNGATSVVLDSTYKEYVFIFKDIHPSASNPNFGFQVDVGTGTSYAQTITSTYFAGYQTEDGGDCSIRICYWTRSSTRNRITNFSRSNW